MLVVEGLQGGKGQEKKDLDHEATQSSQRAPRKWYGGGDSGQNGELPASGTDSDLLWRSHFRFMDSSDEGMVSVPLKPQGHLRSHKSEHDQGHSRYELVAGPRALIHVHWQTGQWQSVRMAGVAESERESAAGSVSGQCQMAYVSPVQSSFPSQGNRRHVEAIHTSWSRLTSNYKSFFCDLFPLIHCQLIGLPANPVHNVSVPIMTEPIT